MRIPRPILLALTLLAASAAHGACQEQRIVLYNRDAGAIEIYRLTDPATPIGPADLLWQSPPLAGGSEVKPISYLGRKALLATTEYGAVIYAYPGKTLLFQREISGAWDMNIHSALALDDGNVLLADSSGKIAILYPGENEQDLWQTTAQTRWYPLDYAHGLAYDEDYRWIYAGGYTTVNKYAYAGSGSQASLQLVTRYDASHYYLRCAHYGICSEDADWEDGIHDLYPVDGDNPHLFFLTTGERSFLFDTSQQADSDNPAAADAAVPIRLDDYPPFYTVDSRYSQQEAPSHQQDKVILRKGGIKSLSGRLAADDYCTLAHAAPYFTEQLQYDYYQPVLLYAQQDADRVDYDLTTENHLQFANDMRISFYKARLLPTDF
jgi:hypothetical protein